MKKYYGELPGYVIWLVHILVGALLIYVGYQIINKKPIPKIIGMLFLVVGSLAALYHVYLWGFGYK